MCFLVTASITTGFGATVYPLPADTIPTESRELNDSITTIWGMLVLGFSVGSDGKSNPISIILVVLIFPIDWLSTDIIAPEPVLVVPTPTMVEIPGRE